MIEAFHGHFILENEKSQSWSVTSHSTISFGNLEVVEQNEAREMELGTVNLENELVENKE